MIPATPTGKPGRALAAMLALAGLLPALAHAAPSAADRAMADAQAVVQRGPTAGALVDLAAAFMRKARETGDPGYYGRAAAALDRAVAIAPGHYGALRARAWVLLGKHEFAAALRAARTARAIEPHDWWNYGNLADACVELGRYDDAVRATTRMMALRPGLPVYTRVAALRALMNDRRGAIEALELALVTADPRDPEERAWILTYLGHEHWALGELSPARARYEEALRTFPDYHLALPGLAHLRAAQGDTVGAIHLYEQALALAPMPAIAGALGDLYAATGDPQRAEATYDFAMYMGRVAEATGTTYGRELALFLADHDRRLPDALRLARQEAGRRGDIYTDDALAWAYYKNGRLADAMRTVHRALRLGTEEALLHYHAGMIAAAAGHDAWAARHLARALALNPHFDLRQAPLARSTLARVVSERLAREEQR
jgi:tetratricopeptide (TPR) repeat protein